MEIGGAPWEAEKLYTLATKPFLLKGGDGYSAFSQFEELIVDDEGIPLITLLRNHFVEVKVLNAMQRAKRVQSLIATAFTSSASHPALMVDPVIDGRIIPVDK